MSVMERVLEPELMDDVAQARAYSAADFSTSNQLFVDIVVSRFPNARRIVDLGCGPGDIDIRLARGFPVAAITAADGSEPMLALARDAARDSGIGNRIRFVRGLIPDLPLDAHAFDAVLSKDLLHHLPNPIALWAEIVRLGQPDAAVCVMDLIRPNTPEDARHIVATVACREAPILQEDFFNSLCAAFTIDEVRDQLRTLGLDLRIERAGERHLFVHGVLPRHHG
jgi:ubiquinone/menaquinone biosynthesis C-methylase UbiE